MAGIYGIIKLAELYNIFKQLYKLIFLEGD